MASKRIFSYSVTESDRFLRMSASAQALYFHANMRADNEGVINAPESMLNALRFGREDLRVLLENGYMIPLNVEMDRILVVRDWFVHNTNLRFDGSHDKRSDYHENITAALELREKKYYLRETSEESPGDFMVNKTKQITTKENNNIYQGAIAQAIKKYNVLEPEIPRMIAKNYSVDKIEEKMLLLLSQKNHIENVVAWAWSALRNDWQISAADWRAAEKATAEMEKIKDLAAMTDATRARCEAEFRAMEGHGRPKV